MSKSETSPTLKSSKWQSYCRKWEFRWKVWRRIMRIRNNISARSWGRYKIRKVLSGRLFIGRKKKLRGWIKSWGKWSITRVTLKPISGKWLIMTRKKPCAFTSFNLWIVSLISLSVSSRSSSKGQNSKTLSSNSLWNNFKTTPTKKLKTELRPKLNSKTSKQLSTEMTNLETSGPYSKWLSKPKNWPIR